MDLPGSPAQLGINLFVASSSTLSNLNKSFVKLCQLEHPSLKVLRVMFSKLCQAVNALSFVCEACQLAKKKRISSPFRGIKSEIPLNIIHSDIWGPSRSPSVHGARWFIVFIDDCTRLTRVYTMKLKSEASTIISSFIKLLQNQFIATLKKFRSDNA